MKSKYTARIIEIDDTEYVLPDALFSEAKARGAFAGVTALSPATMGSSRAIAAVSTGDKEFAVAGDHANDYSAGDTIFVDGSTGNDGTYTVVSATYDGSTNTDIVVEENIPDATADGDIIVPLDLTGCTTGRQYSLTLTANVYGILADLGAGEAFGLTVDLDGNTISTLGLTAEYPGSLLAAAESPASWKISSRDGTTMRGSIIELEA